MKLPGPPPEDAPETLAEAARILRLVNGFHETLPAEWADLTEAQKSAAGMAPVVAESLASVFDRWARMCRYNLGELTRVGGRETLETARWIVNGDHVISPLSDRDEKVQE